MQKQCEMNPNAGPVTMCIPVAVSALARSCIYRRIEYYYKMDTHTHTHTGARSHTLTRDFVYEGKKKYINIYIYNTSLTAVALSAAGHCSGHFLPTDRRLTRVAHSLTHRLVFIDNTASAVSITHKPFPPQPAANRHD